MSISRSPEDELRSLAEEKQQTDSRGETLLYIKRIAKALFIHGCLSEGNLTLAREPDKTRTRSPEDELSLSSLAEEKQTASRGETT
jgi:hypothetical protein